MDAAYRTAMARELRRGMQNRTLAGLDPTDEQQASYDQGAAERDAAGNNLSMIAAELSGVPQAMRAGRGIAEAAIDPSLANMTNAGVQSALAAFRPLAAAKIMAGGLGAAGVKQSGALSIGTANAAEPLTSEQRGKLKGLDAKIAANQWKNGAERRAVEADRASLKEIEREGLKTANASKAKTEEAAGLAEIERKATDDRNRQEAERRAKETKDTDDRRAVIRAEGSREKELARDRRFSDTDVGKVWEKTGGLAPFLAGVGGGAITRAAAGQGTTAAAKYGLPALMGAGAGVTAVNVPLYYDAFLTETDNPQKRAYEAYARDLPADHPDRPTAMDMARALKAENPVRETAQKEFRDGFVTRNAAGALEGGLSGVLGAEMVQALRRMVPGAKTIAGEVAEIPGEVLAGYRRGMQPQAGAALSNEERKLMADALRKEQVPPVTGGGQTQPSKPPTADVLPDGIKSNRTYGQNYSEGLQTYTIDAAERGVDIASKGRSGFNRAQAARDLDMPPTMVKNATENLLAILRQRGIPPTTANLKALRDQLNANPSIRESAGNVVWSAPPVLAAGAGLAANDDERQMMARQLRGY